MWRVDHHLSLSGSQIIAAFSRRRRKGVGFTSLGHSATNLLEKSMKMAKERWRQRGIVPIEETSPSPMVVLTPPSAMPSVISTRAGAKALPWLGGGAPGRGGGEGAPSRCGDSSANPVLEIRIPRRTSSHFLHTEFRMRSGPPMGRALEFPNSKRSRPPHEKWIVSFQNSKGPGLGWHWAMCASPCGLLDMVDLSR